MKIDTSPVNETRHRSVDSSALVFGVATEADVESIAALRTDAAEQLARAFGQGHWSRAITDWGVRSNLELLL
jgi:hypothetical protein